MKPKALDCCGNHSFHRGLGYAVARRKLRSSQQSKAFGFMRATFIIQICNDPMSDANCRQAGVTTTSSLTVTGLMSGINTGSAPAPYLATGQAAGAPTHSA